MRRFAFLVLLLAPPLWADGPEPPKAVTPPPKLTLPAEKLTPVGRAVTISPTTNEGGEVRWLLPDPGLTEDRGFMDLIPEELRGKLTGRMFVADRVGRFRVWAISAKGSVTSEKAECWVIVGDAPPPTPPVPPTPPGPGPGPAPIPGDGLRVLIVYDSATLSSLPKEQISMMYGGELRGYLNTHCVKGADGKTPEWRVWDSSTPTGAESKVWQDAMSRKRDKLPWLVVSNGQKGFEGSLPTTTAETLKIITPIGGN